ncbi:hypothetical protein HYALB_00004003 [Hymenoscyphus albidus]|uniref:Uncharacterized protein n=1 Tax=Hymenoscyphus albidus TaxID=595503 RepID=A0A9N9Q7U4_9HELO|nr:hypothetical protein HYALB_00004003 [Hymenoscyphus albidus]
MCITKSGIFMCGLGWDGARILPSSSASEQQMAFEVMPKDLKMVLETILDLQTTSRSSVESAEELQSYAGSRLENVRQCQAAGNPYEVSSKGCVFWET